MRNSLVFHAFWLARPSQLSITSGQAGSEFLDDHHALSIGFLIAAAIDKYIYINVHRRFVNGFLLKYSHLEEAATIEEIKLPIIKEALRLAGVQERNLEITSIADIPAGTGLGSSARYESNWIW
jgi:D-glycero-alpha-D-manno-heptose-7-phosphate kinase